MVTIAKPDKSARPIWLGEDQRKWDHARIHMQLLKDERLGAYEIAVYVGLAMHAETMTGRCFPATATLARYICADERTVRRAVKNLVKAAYVRLERHPGRANEYFLLSLPVVHTLDSDARGQLDAPDSDAPNPGLTYRGTPDSDTDEREPVTRIKNKAIRIYPQDGHQRMPEPRAYCEECDGTTRRRLDDGRYSHETCESCA